MTNACVCLCSEFSCLGMRCLDIFFSEPSRDGTVQMESRKLDSVRKTKISGFSRRTGILWRCACDPAMDPLTTCSMGRWTYAGLGSPIAMASNSSLAAGSPTFFGAGPRFNTVIRWWCLLIKARIARCSKFDQFFVLESQAFF